MMHLVKRSRAARKKDAVSPGYGNASRRRDSVGPLSSKKRCLMFQNAAVSRRTFVAGAAAAAGVAAASTLAVRPAQAAEDAPTWLEAALGHTDAECTEIVDVDVLVVGAGCSGLPAAVTAAEEGAKVLLIDRMEQGFGIRCSALGAIDSSIQQELGVTINKMDIFNDIARYADGQCDMRIWKMWADESGEAVSWYIDHCNQSGAVYVENE